MREKAVFKVALSTAAPVAVSSDRVDTSLREQPTLTRFNKKKTTFTDEYIKAVLQIKA
jgi:hypothetical protein